MRVSIFEIFWIILSFKYFTHERSRKNIYFESFTHQKSDKKHSFFGQKFRIVYILKKNDIFVNFIVHKSNLIFLDVEVSSKFLDILVFWISEDKAQSFSFGLFICVLLKWHIYSQSLYIESILILYKLKAQCYIHFQHLLGLKPHLKFEWISLNDFIILLFILKFIIILIIIIY